MRLLFTALLAFLCAIVIGVLLARDTGRVILIYGDWTVQTNTTVFAVITLAGVVLAWLLVRIISGIFRLPRSFGRWRFDRRRRRSDALLAQGLLAMVEGDWGAAERAFEKGAPYSRIPLIHHLCAARAAQQQNDAARRDRHLQLAEKAGAESTLAVGLTQAELLLGEGRTQQACAILRDLDATRPGARQVRRLLLEAHGRLRDWGQTLELLTHLEGDKLMPAEQIKAGRVRAYTGLIRDAGRALDRRRLDALWNAIPRRLRREPLLVEAYVGERLRFPGTGDCEMLLRRSIRCAWNKKLVRLYGMVEGSDPAKQLNQAEAWLQDHLRDAALLLTLGRLCRRNRLWGKARSYLEECIGLEPDPESYQELAALLEQRGEAAAAAACYQRGLGLVTGGVSLAPDQRLASAPADPERRGV